MCIGSNWVNHAQDLMSVTKFEIFLYSLIPNVEHSSVKHSVQSNINAVTLSMQ